MIDVVIYSGIINDWIGDEGYCFVFFEKKVRGEDL